MYFIRFLTVRILNISSTTMLEVAFASLVPRRLLHDLFNSIFWGCAFKIEAPGYEAGHLQCWGSMPSTPVNTVSSTTKSTVH